MESDIQSIWKKASILGLIFSFLCLCVSVYQFYTYSEPINFSNGIRRLTSLTINVVMFCCFIMIMFYPHTFQLYAAAFYVYGFGNFLDGGHMLCFVCMGLSALFIYYADGFRKLKWLKATLLIIPVIIGLGVQFNRYKPFFVLITIFHGIGFCLMAFLVYCLFYPIIQQAKSNRKIHYLDQDLFSERDIIWLNKVLEGKRYVEIAVNDQISESAVKARMSEMYKSLGIRSKSEFISMYMGTSFSNRPPEKDRMIPSKA